MLRNLWLSAASRSREATSSNKDDGNSRTRSTSKTPSPTVAVREIQETVRCIPSHYGGFTMWQQVTFKKVMSTVIPSGRGTPTDGQLHQEPNAMFSRASLSHVISVSLLVFLLVNIDYSGRVM